jgi:cytochrome c-type biogenesis protein CcmE
VLAKHDETYMPKELKDAMAKAHEGKQVNEEAGQDKPQ